MPAEFAPILTVFITLFVIIDPIGLAPLFVALTQGRTTTERRRLALTACLVGAGLLTAFGVLGDAVLGFAGISMPAFRIAGGVLLFITALDMLFERRTKRREDQSHANEDDPAVFPLAIPLIAGPGAIATMILLTSQNGGEWAWVLTVHAVMFSVMLLTFCFFLLANPIERALGPVGINVVTRLLGMLLAALSVQFVLDGLRAVGFGG
ncbi:MAG: MarC family protein [Boseongicola sp.]|nr:MarC family protein [Boseongicola sp.]NNJ67697.1 MarC family protein [Boseongicola sp.]